MKRGEEMKAPYRVEVRVVEQHGTCDFGHQVGDLALFDGNGVEGKICWHSLCSMMYKIHGLLYGADYPWLKDGNVASHPCPDYKNPVLYEIRRFKNE
jgi:uncharacterized repeat protein (TIGR04076 family)